MEDKFISIPWKIKHERCALIVIDMQNDFFRPESPLRLNDVFDKIVPNINSIIDTCRKKDIPVIYTKMQHKDEFNISPLEISYHYKPSKPNDPKNPGSKLLREGTIGYEIVDELAPQPSDPIVVKHRYDAFYNTNLRVVLNNIRGLGVVDTVIIVGVLTNVCCESTARSAFMKDYKVVFVSDANGTFDEALHRATLFNISSFFGRVLDTKALIKALNEGENDKIAVID